MLVIIGGLLALAHVGLGQTEPRPQIVATSPAAGDVISAGELTLSVTFDRPMRSGGYSFVAPDPDAFPDCDGNVVQSADKRTFSMKCEVEGGRGYRVGFNGVRFHNFVSEETGTPADPREIEFLAR